MNDGRLMILKQWTPASTFDRDVLSSLPIWIRIPSLPLKVWSKKAISEICSAIGKPIQMDSLTAKHERLLYARALVEVSASKPPPSTIDVIIEEAEYKLPIEYEWIPPHCDRCFSFEHITADRNCFLACVPKSGMQILETNDHNQKKEPEDT